MTEPLAPDAVRALIVEVVEALRCTRGGDADLVRRLSDVLSASLPREDADLEVIESRAAWAGSYSTDGVQAAAERFRIAREDVPALLARVRTAETAVDYWRTQVVAARAAEKTPVHCPSCDGYQTAVMDDGQRSIGVCEGVGSRTVETAEEWEYGAHVTCDDGYQLMREPEFVGTEDSARYWLTRPITALSRQAIEGRDHIEIERRHPAGQWEPVPPTPEEADKP